MNIHIMLLCCNFDKGMTDFVFFRPAKIITIFLMVFSSCFLEKTDV